MRLIGLILAGLMAGAPARAQEVRGFWVDGFNEGIKSPEEVQTLLRRLRAANCNAVFAQVRKSGDAYYQSRYEPWAADNPQRFDALAYLIQQAHSGTPRIAVHAWINTCAVGKSHGNPHHIALAHPDYLSLSDTGENYDGEATKIDPGNPDAADWTFRVYLDVVRHYDVDGIHFDFVRYGDTDGKGRFGYNPASVARFNARYRRSGHPDRTDPLWKQWRRDQVTALVRKVYTMATALRPDVAVSAATITWGEGPHDLRDPKTGRRVSAEQFWNEKSAPMNRTFQDWRSWMREGILDLNCQMAYYREAQHPDWFRQWIQWGKDNQFRRWVVPGTGAWLNPPADTLKQIAAVRAPRRHPAHGVLLYSYSGVSAGPDGKEQKPTDDFFSDLARPSALTQAPPFAKPSAHPELPWKVHRTTGQVYGFVHTGDDLRAVDGLAVALAGKGQTRRTTTDGTGFFAFIDLPPGSYRLHFADESRDEDETVPVGPYKEGRTTHFRGAFPGQAISTGSGIDALAAGARVKIVAERVVAGSDLFPGDLYVAQSAGRPIRVRLARPPVLALQSGDVVAVIGEVADVEGERIVDRAVARLVGMQRAQNEQPRQLSGAELLTADPLESRSLVRFSGRVVESWSDRFIVEDPSARVEVACDRVKGPGVEDEARPLASPGVGDECQVAGVCTLTHHADGTILLRIHPRSAADLVVTYRRQPVAIRAMWWVLWVLALATALLLLRRRRA